MSKVVGSIKVHKQRKCVKCVKYVQETSFGFMSRGMQRKYTYGTQDLYRFDPA